MLLFIYGSVVWQWINMSYFFSQDSELTISEQWHHATECRY